MDLLDLKRLVSIYLHLVSRFRGKKMLGYDQRDQLTSVERKLNQAQKDMQEILDGKITSSNIRSGHHGRYLRNNPPRA